MDRIFKVIRWVVVAVLGLVVWTVFREVQTIIACLLAAILIFYVFFATVKGTVGQLIGDQTSSPFAVSYATMPPCCSHSMVECKGKDLCDMPLIHRKGNCSGCSPERDRHPVRRSFRDDGEAVFRHACLDEARRYPIEASRRTVSKWAVEGPA